MSRFRVLGRIWLQWYDKTGEFGDSLLILFWWTIEFNKLQPESARSWPRVHQRDPIWDSRGAWGRGGGSQWDRSCDLNRKLDLGSGNRRHRHSRATSLHWETQGSPKRGGRRYTHKSCQKHKWPRKKWKKHKKRIPYFFMPLHVVWFVLFCVR